MTSHHGTIGRSCRVLLQGCRGPTVGGGVSGNEVTAIMRRIQQGGTWSAGTEYLAQGVVWIDGIPHLDVVDIRRKQVEVYPVLGQRVGLEVASDRHFCMGRYAPVGGTGIAHVPCPAQSPATEKDQCSDCAARDEFRFAHHVHRGGYLPDVMATYLAQPHWVYVATFADGSSKVGTAAAVRKRSRLDEQGATTATYVALAGNGRIARFAEDEATQQLHLRQTKRRSAKVAALVQPAPPGHIEQQHRETVERLLHLLKPMTATTDLALPVEHWVPPAAYAPFLDERSRTDWVPYPHDLGSGEHGLYIEGCAGPAALVRTRDDADAPYYVADLGLLKGRRVIAGDHVSPDATVQTALF